MPGIEARFGVTTFALLSKCAKCGKPYSPMEEWTTAYTVVNEQNQVYWTIQCKECAEKERACADRVRAGNPRTFGKGRKC